MSSRRVIALLSVAVAGALAATACGEESDEDQINTAIEDTYAAFGEEDGETFCANLSSDYLPDFEDYYGGDCAEKVASGELQVELTDETQAQVESPEITEVTIDGDTAQTTVNGEDLEVVNEDGEWKLDDFDVPGGE